MEDSSQKYAIIKSPTPIVVGTDYATVGYATTSSAENNTFTGILNTLPAGALIVDSVGTVEGGSGDRHRVLFTEAPGVRVHQPEGFGAVGGASNDGMSRRDGFRDPNSIGSWFSGEVVLAKSPDLQPVSQRHRHQPQRSCDDARRPQRAARDQLQHLESVRE